MRNRMNFYSKKYRDINLTPRELFIHERIKQRAKLERHFSGFGLNLIHGEYTARIALAASAFGVLFAGSIIAASLSAAADKQESRRTGLVSDLAEQQRIADY